MAILANERWNGKAGKEAPVAYCGQLVRVSGVSVQGSEVPGFQSADYADYRRFIQLVKGANPLLTI